MISISIVSHGQFDWVKTLLADLERVCHQTRVEIILTINIPEKLDYDFHQHHFEVSLIHNLEPKGFGANHNQAFKKAKGEYFCVLNPDIRLIQNPFDEMLNHLKNHKTTGVVGPLVMNSEGQIEDSARRTITLSSLILRQIKKWLNQSTREYFYTEHSNECIYPDWIAGMFMLFPQNIYENIRGFDERYFLYCEDMDICNRLKKQHADTVLLPNVKVIHASQRDSHKKWRYFCWHVRSLVRFLYDH